MLPAFNTGLGIPLSDSNPAQRTAKRPAWSPYSSMAEATTLRMEYAALSHATGARAGMHDAAREMLRGDASDASSDCVIRLLRRAGSPLLACV